jgi:histidyl-tRNA synthetase
MINPTGPVSGFKDYYGERAVQKKQMLAVIEKVYQQFGFNLLETPVVEKKQTLVGKGGGENEKLMYSVLSSNMQSIQDAELGLRFDLTVPLARFAAEHGGQILQSIPFKRYAIGDVFRGERAQKGRYRSFVQCDADTVGLEGALCEAEIIQLMQVVFAKLGVPVVIRVNNRLLLDGLAEHIGAVNDDKKQLISIIDDCEKVGLDKTKEVLFAAYGEAKAVIVLDYIASKKDTNEQTLSSLSALLGSNEVAAKGIANLIEIRALVGDNIVIDPVIARGLDYYTGIIYETNITSKEEYGSVCSGGRYDNLIEALGGPKLCAAGTSFGVDRLFGAMEELNKLHSTTKELYYVSVFGEEFAKDSFAIATKLRLQYENDDTKQVILCLNPHKKLGKQLAEAESLGASYVIIMGSEEKEKGVYKLKNMKTGAESIVIQNE